MPCKSSRRARGCGGRRRMPRTRSSGSAHAATRSGSSRSSVTPSTSSISPRPTARSTRSRSRRCAPLDTAAAIGADGVVFHLGSHLGVGMAKGLKRAVPPLRQLLELYGPPALARARELRRRGRHDGTVGGRARRDLRWARRASAARHLPRLVPLVGLGRRRDRRAARRLAARRARRVDLVDQLGCGSTMPTQPSGRTATATRRSRRDRSATGWRRSSPIPRSRASRRSSRPRARRATPRSSG